MLEFYLYLLFEEKYVKFLKSETNGCCKRRPYGDNHGLLVFIQVSIKEEEGDVRLTRREFHKLVGAGLISYSIPGMTVAAKDDQVAKGLPMVQGATNSSQTQISILGHIDNPYDFICVEISTQSRVNIHKVVVHERPFSEWIVYHVFIDNLQLSKFYELQVFDSKSGDLLDARGFQALNTHESQLHWVFGSCMYDGKHKKEIWDRLYEQNPDFILFIGDTVYIDRKWSGSNKISEERIWGRHVQARMTLDIYYWSHLKPVVAVWDDHDYGLNNSDRTFAFKEKSKDVFEVFFPCQPIRNFSLGPGVAKKVSFANQDFILLDNRSFRSEKKAKKQQYFGELQMEWLEGIVDSTKFSWLLQGSQWTAPYGNTESFKKTHPIAFKETFQRLSQLKSQFILCSGDVHFSEVSKIDKSLLGYSTFELTSSSFHSRSVPGYNLVFKNPNRVKGTSTNNFLMVHSEYQGEKIAGEVQCFNYKSNKAKFTVSLG